jgi:hypothetical protein
MQNIIIFSCFRRHLEKIAPIVNTLHADRQYRADLILLTDDEKSWAEKKKMSYRSLDEYSTRIRHNQYDWDWAALAMNHAVETLQPKLIILPETNYVYRSLIHVCKKRGIQSLILQHGVPLPISEQSFVPMEAEIIAVWGNETKEQLEKLGIPAQKIAVTGAPLYDVAPQFQPTSGGNKKLIFFGGSPGLASVEDNETFVQAVFTELGNLIDSFGYLNVIYRLHPGEGFDDLQMRYTCHPKIDVQLPEDTSLEAMGSADLMATFISTVYLDAIATKTPFFMLDATREDGMLPEMFRKLSYVITDPKELSNVIKSFFKRPNTFIYNWAELQQHFLNGLNGKATEAVMQIIQNLMTKKPVN